MLRPLSSIRHLALRPRWTLADARAVLAALDDSGLSVAAFAALHGVQAQRVFLWRRRLASTPPIAPTPVTFVEVSRPASPALPTGTRYEIALPNGVTVRIEGAIEPLALAALLSAVRAC